jgi:hypothetical protein
MRIFDQNVPFLELGSSRPWLWSVLSPMFRRNYCLHLQGGNIFVSFVILSKVAISTPEYIIYALSFTGTFTRSVNFYQLHGVTLPRTCEYYFLKNRKLNWCSVYLHFYPHFRSCCLCTNTSYNRDLNPLLRKWTRLMLHAPVLISAASSRNFITSDLLPFLG